MKNIAIIAGEGQLPHYIISHCQKHKIAFVCVLITPFAKKEDYSKYKYIEIGIGEVGKAVSFMKESDIDNICFAGGVKKPNFSTLKSDKDGLLLIGKILKNRIIGDDSVLRTVNKFLEGKGFSIIALDKILGDIKIKEGFLIGDNHFSQCNSKDIELGIKILKGMSKFDIGQAIVIQQGTVLGVEGAEGTEELIKRCGKLKYSSGDAPVLVKIKKLNQTKKADLPTIGIETLVQLEKAGFAGIAIDRKNCLVLNQDKIIEEFCNSVLFIKGIKIK